MVNWNAYTAGELKKFISDTNIKNYTVLKKPELVALMINHAHRFTHIGEKVRITKKQPERKTKPPWWKASKKKEKPEPKEAPKPKKIGRPQKKIKEVTVDVGAELEEQERLGKDIPVVPLTYLGERYYKSVWSNKLYDFKTYRLVGEWDDESLRVIKY